MTKEWQQFLMGQGGLLHHAALNESVLNDAALNVLPTRENHIANFGNPHAELQAANSSAVLADLSHLGLLQLEGVDAVNFLQGQVTNDVKLLDGSNSHYTGYCSPKGRLLALFLAFAHQDHLHLQVDAALLEPIMKRLKMYVMRSKVVITDVSSDIQRFGVAGANSTMLLADMFTQLPQQPYAIVSLANATLIRLPGALPRYQIFTASGNAPSLWQQLASKFQPVGKPVWDYLEIQVGIPEIVAATQESFVPQMINLDALQGINFKKGCYTGQEIVARTHYLGKVKRRTQLAHIDSANAMPLAGEAVHAANSQDVVGQIVRSAPAPQGGFDVLAELRLEIVEAGNIEWQGLPLQIKQLPYSL